LAVIVTKSVENPAGKAIGIGARAKETSDGERPTKATTQTLSRDRDLARLLEEYNDGGVSELLFAQDSINQSVRRSTIGEKKIHLIPDYISHRRGTIEEDDDSFVTTKGRTYKLEGRQRKLAASEVSIPQWITANERIREILSITFSKQEARDYAKYVRQIGDLLQIYSSDSIFTLDNVHRKEMAVPPIDDEDKRWCDIDPHLVNFYLERGVKKNGGSSTDNSSAQSGVGGSGKVPKKKKKLAHPCVRFNSSEGCKYGNNCSFPHICSESNCMGSHPNHEHNHFRKDASGKSTS